MKFWHRALKVSGWRAYSLDIFLGAVGVFGYAPFHLWPLTLLTFMWLMGRMAYTSQGFWPAFRIGLGYFLANTFWIGSAFIVRGPEFIPAMPPMILGLAGMLAFFWGLVGWIYKRFFDTSQPKWLVIAALIFLAEFARGHIFGGFPWNLPGYMFEAGQPLSQFAAIGGIYGVSLIILCIAAALASLVSKPRLNPALGAVVPIALLYLFGSWHLSKADINYVKDVKFRLVQHPFSQSDKFEAHSATEIFHGFMRLSLEPGLENITHVVWPEGAVVGNVLDHEALISSVGQAFAQNSTNPPYWVMNSLRLEQYAERADPVYYNTSAIIAYDRSGVPALKGFNDKYRLVPFGEFIPGGKLIENLGAKVLSVSLGSITPASEKTLVEFPGLPTGSTQLCYEIVFSGLTPRPDGQRAKWILNQSNDAWFGRSTGPAQHANIAAYRALEEGLPVIRSASNGVTGLIDPYGRYQSKLNPVTGGVVDVFLPEARQRYYYGKNLHFAIVLILLIFLCMVRLSYRK